jgi:hypothetical protein
METDDGAKQAATKVDLSASEASSPDCSAAAKCV